MSSYVGARTAMCSTVTRYPVMVSNRGMFMVKYRAILQGAREKLEGK